MKERIGRRCYLYHYQSGDYHKIKLDFIRYIVPYHPSWKITSVLKSMIEEEQRNAREITEKHLIGIVLHDMSEASIGEVQDLIRKKDDIEFLEAERNCIQIKTNLRHLEELAECESVRSIVQPPQPTLINTQVRNATGIDRMNTQCEHSSPNL